MTFQSKLEKAAELGAVKTLNYKENDFGEEWAAEKIDVILDCVGGDYWRKNMKVLSDRILLWMTLFRFWEWMAS